MQKETIHLKLNHKHPMGFYRVQNLQVKGMVYAPYEIDETNGQKIIEELQQKGVRHWVSCKELEDHETEELDEDELEIVHTPTGEVVTVDEAAAALGLTPVNDQDVNDQVVNDQVVNDQVVNDQVVNDQVVNDQVEDKPKKKK